MKHLVRLLPLALLTAALVAKPALTADKSFILQSTTSTANSGLYDFLLPIFTEKTGITVNVVAVGTGQAIKNSQNGDGDVLLVHATAAEEQFVAEGYGVARFDVMYNDFIIVGPPTDPAGIGRTTNSPTALAKIAAAKAPFASRADNSGTHQKEMQLWQEAGIDPAKDSGTWYRETGSGMGTTLNAAVGMGAYTITDRGTWISFKNKGDYRILVEGDRNLINQYGIILVNPKKHPSVKVEEGQAFVDWILSDAGQAAIASYKIDGQQLFIPSTRRPPGGRVAGSPEALGGSPRLQKSQQDDRAD
jgi:tungstate transport system substrate-binding protein